MFSCLFFTGVIVCCVVVAYQRGKHDGMSEILDEVANIVEEIIEDKK